MAVKPTTSLGILASQALASNRYWWPLCSSLPSTPRGKKPVSLKNILNEEVNKILPLLNLELQVHIFLIFCRTDGDMHIKLSCMLDDSGCLEEKLLHYSLSSELKTYYFHKAPFSLERIIDTLWIFCIGIFSRFFLQEKAR